jgi:hypothetical protein
MRQREREARAQRSECPRQSDSGPQEPPQEHVKALESMTEKADLLILLDWDDTILPTSFLSQRSISLDDEVPHDVQEVLRTYCEVVRKTLVQLKERGHLVIVTNAEQGWVELTMAQFLPGLEPLLQDVECVSARSLFEPKGYTLPVEWKEEAFAEVVQRLCSEPRGYPVLSLGDARHERDAVHRVAHRLGIAAKSVKLMEVPDLLVLQREHDLLQERLPYLCEHDGSLDIRVDGEA